MSSICGAGVKKPKINLWVYNHPFFGISDQVAFFAAACEQNGYEVAVGDKPRHDALNVVIENFEPKTRNTLAEFCRNSQSRVAVIMTEHIDFMDPDIFIHGDPLWQQNDYMHPATQISRLRNLISLQPYLRCLFVLGDLPKLNNIDGMILGINVYNIPFPTIEMINTNDTTPKGELIFTGFYTDYRRSVLAGLSASGLAVHSPPGLVSSEARDKMNGQAKLALNIPQRKNWRWLSSMRILAALRCGRATVSLGTKDISEMAKCTYQIDLDKDDWKDVLKSHVGNWRGLYEEAHSNYTAMADDFARRHPFPHDIMEFWALTNRLPEDAFA
ncbi:hypothetical protein GCM10011491_45280 [Brucella endophytica]|uniref:Uncharacterized protein n=1 Tax=Brucella endophytica TaxID=1963359 RepID=A0A916ST14_9HYPH|nr:hypothetical protein [Brucella endophytica]GGB12356.1 hypothetical protein GCM10011491_45280 [Brucella endophytica]